MTALVVVPLPTGQATLFEDPQALLSMPMVDLDALAINLAQATKGYIATLRRLAGLMCWAQRSRRKDGEYGVWVEGFASALGVTPRTLLEWRRQVEAAEHLGPSAWSTVAPPENRRSNVRSEISADASEAFVDSPELGRLTTTAVGPRRGPATVEVRPRPPSADVYTPKPGVVHGRDTVNRTDALVVASNGSRPTPADVDLVHLIDSLRRWAVSLRAGEAIDDKARKRISALLIEAANVIASAP